MARTAFRVYSGSFHPYFINSSFFGVNNEKNLNRSRNNYQIKTTQEKPPAQEQNDPSRELDEMTHQKEVEIIFAAAMHAISDHRVDDIFH
jgi:galactose mutarotase-like enzyme